MPSPYGFILVTEKNQGTSFGQEPAMVSSDNKPSPANSSNLEN